MGTAVDLDMSERLLEVEVPSDQGEGTMRAYVPCKSCISAKLLGSLTQRYFHLHDASRVADLRESLADVQMTS